MTILSLCGYLPTAPEKKTFRQRLLELAGRCWSVWVDLEHRFMVLRTQAMALFHSVTGFWGRFSSAVGVVLAATIFNIAPYGVFKVLSAIAFLLASEAMVVTSWPAVWNGTVTWLRTTIRLLTKRGLQWKPLTPRMREIADRMGVKMDKIGVMDELDNAVSLPAFKTIIIGRPLYDRLTETDLESVFAHELAHIKEKHNLVLLIAVPVIFSQLVLWFTLPVQMFAIAGLAFSRIAFIPFNWLAEIRADQVGARYVGNDSMIHALQSIDGKRMDEHSESHPSLRRRIRRLEKGPVSARWYFVVISFILAGAALAWLLILA